MAKERDGRDGDAAVGSQSKRAPSNQVDSDSQGSDQQIHHQPAQQQQQGQQQSAAQPRTKSQKHVVGGGTGGRLHARVPSSKALHKHHTSTSSAKLNRRHTTSPSPERGTGTLSGHRRVASDLKMSRDSSSTNLKKNASHNSLHRNKSNSDVTTSKKRAQAKRTSSSSNVEKLKMTAGGKVQFKLGDDEDDEEEEEEEVEDEWVDASASASPHLSRRASTINGDQQTADGTSGRNDARPKSSESQGESHEPPKNSTNYKAAAQPDRNSATYLTSRLLQRTPSFNAPPQTSKETAVARPPSLRQTSPEAEPNDDTSSTLSGTPQTMERNSSGGSEREGLTSRFLGNSQGSGSTPSAPGNSFMTPMQAASQMIYARSDGDAHVRAKSAGNLQGRHAKLEAAQMSRRPRTGEEDESTRQGIAAGARQRPQSEFMGRTTNRTQQKLNLERASSTLESSQPHHRAGVGMGLGPGVSVAAAASGLDSRDPRMGTKVLERTGMEYLVVRRYQNPVARSIHRLTQLPGIKSRHIPTRPGTAHSKRGSEYGSTFAGLSQSARDREPFREPHNVAALMASQMARRPSTPGQGMSMNGGGYSSGIDHDDDLGRIHEGSNGLSGASLVDGEEEAGTITLLRNMWDKTMDLSGSQD